MNMVKHTLYIEIVVNTGHCGSLIALLQDEEFVLRNQWLLVFIPYISLTRHTHQTPPSALIFSLSPTV